MMKIKEMNNDELLRYYAFHLKQIENDYRTKKEFEDEMKDRFDSGELKNKERKDENEFNS